MSRSVRAVAAQMGKRTNSRAYCARCLSEKEEDSPELGIFTSDMSAVREEDALHSPSSSFAGGPFTATRGGGGRSYVRAVTQYQRIAAETDGLFALRSVKLLNPARNLYHLRPVQR